PATPARQNRESLHERVPGPLPGARVASASERRPDRKLEVGALLPPVREREAVLVEDRLRVEVDAVDEPERRLEDREKDPHLEAGGRAHLDRVERLPLEPRV